MYLQDGNEVMGPGIHNSSDMPQELGGVVSLRKHGNNNLMSEQRDTKHS